MPGCSEISDPKCTMSTFNPLYLLLYGTDGTLILIEGHSNRQPSRHTECNRSCYRTCYSALCNILKQRDLRTILLHELAIKSSRRWSVGKSSAFSRPTWHKIRSRNCDLGYELLLYSSYFPHLAPTYYHMIVYVSKSLSERQGIQKQERADMCCCWQRLMFTPLQNSVVVWSTKAVIYLWYWFNLKVKIKKKYSPKLRREKYSN